MQELKEDPIFKFHLDTLEVVRKIYNFDKPGTMDAAIDILEEWIKKQDHFNMKTFDRAFLERVIVRSKCSVERAKERLDKYCTARTLYSSFFQKNNIEELTNPDMLFDAYLPKLTKQHYRIYLLKINGTTFNPSFYDNYYHRLIHVMEHYISRDYCTGITIIVDYRKTNILNYVKTLDPFVLQQILTISIGCFGVKLKAIHLLSNSSVIDMVVAILKQILSEKLGNRIMIHKDLDTLHQHIEQDILPKEYGGTEKSLEELYHICLDVLSAEDHQAYMKSMLVATTNESLRRKDKLNEQYLGMPGTFRTLSVD